MKSQVLGLTFKVQVVKKKRKNQKVKKFLKHNETGQSTSKTPDAFRVQCFFSPFFHFVFDIFPFFAFLFIFVFFFKFFTFGQVKGNARDGWSRHRPTKVFEFVKLIW